jgi:RNA polymerase sigma-70 factor (ECF subfamily)
VSKNLQQIDLTSAIRSWVESYSDQLFTWAFHKTGNRQAAEDIVQETFLAAYQSFNSFSAKSNPKTWLFSILNHKIMDYYRALYREKEKTGITGNLQKNSVYTPFDVEGNWIEKERPTDWAHASDELLDNPEFNKVMQLCMGKLPDHWRAVLHLKYMDEKKGEEICQELNIAPTNFWQILHRAKLQMRKCLENGWFKK